MAKSKRFEVWTFVMGDDGNSDWQMSESFADLSGADGYVRQSLMGARGVRTARIIDSTEVIKPREYNCLPSKAAS